MSALEYAKSKLFGPLGITKVSWQHDPQGISNGGWGLSLLPRDMAKIGYLYLRKGAWEGQELLPPGWIDKVSHATVDMRLGGTPVFQPFLGSSGQAGLHGGWAEWPGDHGLP
jgi:CubicO group peptidase (beta-lactamase class C family)